MENLSLFSIAAVFLIIQSNLLHAESQTIYMDVRKSTDAIYGVYQYCSEAERRQLDKRFQIDSFEETDRKMGVVSPFKLTTHIYSIDKSKGNDVGITIYYAGPKEKINCAATVIISTPISKIEIRSSYRESGKIMDLPSKQLAAVEATKKKCDSLGKRAREYYPYGNYFLSDEGHVVEDPLRFSCESAAINNTSAIDVDAGSSRFRISVVYNIIFIEDA